MFGLGLARKGLKAVATGNTQASLGLQSPHLPNAVVRLGRGFFGFTGVWIGAVWYTGYANMRTEPGTGPKLVLPGAKVIGPPDRPDRNPKWAKGGKSSGSNPSQTTPAPNPKLKPGSGPLLASHPELKPGVSRLAAMVLKQFPNLIVTATTNGTHASGSYHYLGRAIDLSSSNPAYMNQAAAWINRALASQLVEGIHNPGLSIKNGQPVPPSFWGSQTWQGHANHIHLAV